MNDLRTTVATPFGEVEVLAVNSGRVSFWANGPLNVPERRRTIWVNKVEYTLVAHFVRNGNTGGWSYEHFSISKAGTFKHDDFTWPAFNKVHAALLEVVAAWADSDAGRQFLADAEALDHEEKISQARRDVEAAKALLATNEAHLDSLLVSAPSIFGAASAELRATWVQAGLMVNV